MLNDEIKKIAKQFIDDQKRILEEHGDSVVRSRYQDALASAEKTFKAISAPPKLDE